MTTTGPTQVTGTRAGVTRYPRYAAAVLGFGNYWYPVMFSRSLRRRPVPAPRYAAGSPSAPI